MTAADRFGHFVGSLAIVLIAGGARFDEFAQPPQGGAAAEPSAPLTVCAIPASMPRAGKSPDGTPDGLDVAVVQHLGRLMGRAIVFHWCANAQCAWHCLPEGRCDVVVGQPSESGPPRDVAWSVAYAAAQFGLVGSRDTQDTHSLAELRGKRIGIVAGTVPISDQDHAVARFKSREELLDGFRAAKLDAALLDADFAAWYLHAHPQLGLRLMPEYSPRERWNMALAVRAKDAQLLVEMNRALAQLAESGELRRIYARFGVTLRPPFTAPEPKVVSPNTWQRIGQRGVLVVCADPANLPYSSARDDRPGIDVELARILAQRLGVKLRIDWLDIQHETAVGRLLEHQCDLVLGEAIAANAVVDDEELAGKVLYSRPYYGTGYVLVRRKNGPLVKFLAELKGAKSERLGTEAGSLADYSLRQRGYLRRLYRNQLAALKAISDGAIDHAYLWANVGWTLSVSPDLNAELVPNYIPEDHWNIAVAMCRGDDELKRHVDSVLDALIAEGTVERVLGRYHVPYHAVFSEPAHDAQSHTGRPIRHQVVKRGPEPQMQKIQTSKHAYTGLSRIRSAGELVVGLDQNNLPFSTAHPQPSGLDYELASLLAQELGVKLRVFWAYSAHDSYPSKLATKGLCDVILGVMPDDRFGARVLYSRPYYHACYQQVFRSGTVPPGKEEPLAVEEGVAVRGLDDRAVRLFPSTEAILTAVATGKVPSGYVISTRGPWLAEEHWPGKLTFVPAIGATQDHFPICAAVRKSDRDLKDAIDRAWDDLDRSGRLVQVLARWHIDDALNTVRDARKESTR
jgi:polar amino acid transport system substrate-binding protein